MSGSKPARVTIGKPDEGGARRIKVNGNAVPLHLQVRRDVWSDRPDGWYICEGGDPDTEALIIVGRRTLGGVREMIATFHDALVGDSA